MPYTIRWYIEGHVIYSNLSGEMTSEDLTKATAEVSRLMALYPDQRIDSIIDQREITATISVSDFVKHIPLQNLPHGGWIIIVGAKGVSKFLTVALTQIFRIRFRLFDTPTEARQFLAATDPHLATLLPTEDELTPS